ncbi:MAG: DNA/RNA non-specific endonuclease, partial [Firmicutes bacterium]|nr:DNA/RNA non-specific endonuclease [Bacillota bacterium]
TKGWFTGFTKAIKGEQVIDEKYTLENLFSGNLTVEDMPDFPEYMTMVGATIGAKYRGLWNSAKGTYDGIITLATEPEKVLEVASDAILDFMEDPWESTKEFVGNIRDDVVDAVWRSTPQEISEDAGEILGDVLTGIATGGGGKAAAGGAKMAGNKLLALGKTGAKEFAEGLGDLGKIGAKNVAYVGATTGMENASKNAFRNRLMMMASETGDKAKKVTGIAEGAVSKVDDATKMAGKTGSVANNVTSTTGELIENAVIGTPIVEGSKKAGKIVKDEVVDNAENKIEKKVTQETVENKVVRGESGKGKGDGVQTSSAVNKSQVNNITSTTTNTTINNTVTNGVQTVQYGQHFEKVDKKKVLKANVKYTDSNGYTYITDSQRRITSAEGTLKLQKGTRNLYSQKTVGGTDRLNIDDGGHLFGTQFNGSGEIDNLLPQNKYVNRSGGEWYNMEKKWAKALEEGKKVEVKIDIVYNNNSIRPSDYLVSYKIDGVEYFKNIENFNFRPQKE